MSLAQLEPRSASARTSLPAAHAWPHWRTDPSWVVFSALLCGLLYVGRSSFFQDPGTFWHTVVGRQMLDTRQLVEFDTFSFTAQGDPWLAQQWLGEVTLAALHRAGGWDAQLLGAAALLAGLYSFLAMRLRRGGLNWILVAAFAALAIGAGSHHFHVRPHLFTLACMGLMYGLMCDVEAGRRPVSSLWLLVPLVALWTNLHGGALGGLASIALVLGGWLAAARLGYLSPVQSRKDYVSLLLIAAFCGLAALANPWSWRLPLAWLKIMRMSLPEMIEEHARLSIFRPEGWLTLACATIYLAALYGLLRSRCGSKEPSPLSPPRIAWLLPLPWLLLSIDRVRNAPIFAVLAMLAVAEIVPRMRWRTWLQSNDWLAAIDPKKLHESRPRSFAWLPCAVATIAIGFPLLHRHWARLDERVWPVDLLPALASLEQDLGAEGKLFNSLDYGGFLIFHCPKLKIFIDDRCELYGEAALRNYCDAEANNPQKIEAWQRRYGFRAALVRNDSPFDGFLARNAAWELIQRGACGSLYRLKQPVLSESTPSAGA